MALGSILLYGLGAFIVYRWYVFQSFKAKLRDIPTIGGDGFLSAYISAWKSIFNHHLVIQEGYTKYPNAVFKTPYMFTRTGWRVIVTGKLAEDIRKASPQELSFRLLIREVIQADHMLDVNTMGTTYHIDTVRVALTRNYGARFADLVDEINAAADDLLQIGDDWTSFPVHETMIHWVARVSNRVLVGLPLCRNPEYLRLNEKAALNIFLPASFLHLFTEFLQPLIGKLITQIPKTSRGIQKHLGPVIEQRLLNEKKYGSQWEGKPNDAITWLLDSAPSEHRSIQDIVHRIMMLNVASIHTTSMVSSNIIFYLAAHQEYIEPLRAEIEEVIATEGWTKESMSKMHKLDSFAKEVNRLAGIGASSLGRMVLKDFRLSNGVVVPAGCSISVASYPVHLNPDIYNNPETFDGFRFAKSKDAEVMEDAERLTNQMVTLDYNYLLFGHGRNACPGRFFAVSEIKAILAHILVNYDLKLPNDATTPPPGNWFAGAYSPDSKATVLFKKRVDIRL
ncbi:cytochrome P450 [Coprinopsis marcescibilis]|uniref:Cytochrome P450 n=1 Tax=Coprinopsis marcescibilis TaxID=230819 RepID=A0A5C3KCY2_COPMA|nr:cytochrome P450 [Coprinopsis marcescibilis]